MSNSDDGSPDVNPQEESSRLREGLRHCRSVLESYRVMLTGRAGGQPVEPPPALNDNSE